MDHRLEWAGEQNSMSTGFLWRIDWAADSEPNSMTFRLGWRMDHGLGLGRRTKFHDDWISSRMEDSADRPEFDDYCSSFPMDDRLGS